MRNNCRMQSEMRCIYVLSVLILAPARGGAGYGQDLVTVDKGVCAGSVASDLVPKCEAVAERASRYLEAWSGLDLDAMWRFVDSQSTDNCNFECFSGRVNNIVDNNIKFSSIHINKIEMRASARVTVRYLVRFRFLLDPDQVELLELSSDWVLHGDGIWYLFLPPRNVDYR
jgi:hypothetical protein